MAQTFQQYMTEALGEAGLNDEQITSALTKLYAHDKLSPKLNSIVKTATEDYNAEVGRVRQLREQNDKREKEVADYYTRVNTEYQRVLGELQQAQNGQQPQFDAS